MSDEHIQLERQGKVGIIRMNRPDKLNAVTTAMLHRFTQAMHDYEADPEIRAIVVCGAGKSFSAGRDLKEVQGFQAGSSDTVNTAQAPVYELFTAFSESSKVTVAVVQGYAMGFGCAIAANADLTVAEDNAVLAMSEARRGLGTLAPLPALLHALPYKVLLEMVITGDNFDPERAMQIGLVNRIAPSGKGMEVAMDWLNSFLDNDHGYIRDTKAALRIVRNLTDRDAMGYLVDKSSLHHAAGVGQHGIAEFNKS